MNGLRSRLGVAAVAAVACLIFAQSGGCGSKPPSGFDTSAQDNNPSGATPSGDADSGTSFAGATNNDNGSTGVLFSADAGPIAAPCTGGGLQCYVPTGCNTTLSGTVYDPAGKNPLYNVAVFVPNDPAGKLPAIQTGTHSCNSCDTPIGDYVAIGVTDAKGHFSISGVPATTHVPLVVQVGKWRREVFLSQVKSCTDNQVPAAASRLPKNRNEGDMPQMGLLTGGLDDLGCFLKRMGIDDGEYSAPRAGGRLDIYQGLDSPLGVTIGNGPGLSNGQTAGNCTTASCPLWASKSSLEYYDMVLLACEGSESNQTKPAAAMTAMHDWLGEGGKVFATHFHYTWFKNGPTDFQSVATWLGSSAGIGAGNYTVNTGFPKGQTFHDWLGNVGALTGNAIAMNGVATSVSTIGTPATGWISDPNTSPADVKYLSFLTPIGGLPGGGPLPDAGAAGDAAAGEPSAPQYCGKAVFSDLHAGGGPAGDIPGACSTAAMSAQEKALEFLFFDLAACVHPDQLPPPPPPQSVQ
jgi:hypothetical protein